MTNRTLWAIALLLLAPLVSYADQEPSNQPVQQTKNDWDQDWDQDWNEDWEENTDQPFQFTGFVEFALGTRLFNDPALSSDSTVQDLNLRLENSQSWQQLNFTAKLDVLLNGVTDKNVISWRELHINSPLGENFNVKAGRQILTWGTGDLLFLNDLFAKDWQSFFAGRNTQYLKAPTDAIKLSGYFDFAYIDIVWTPEFSADSFINGQHFSFFNPVAGQQIAPAENFITEKQNNQEWAIRIYRTIGQTEWALYGYEGFSKSPESFTPDYNPYFAPLSVLGASAITPIGKGLLNVEVAQYKSSEDKQGDNPLVKNSQWRALIGYEQEIATRLTAGFQLYLEHTSNYSAQQQNSLYPDWESKQNRTVVTNRMTYRNSSDTTSWSLFTFWSPSDHDGYLRPAVSYRVDDNWNFSAGGNLFFGRHQHSFFGQFKDASNLYFRIRYNF